MTSSELYALSQDTKCTGNLECHWCGSPCQQLWTHDNYSILPYKHNLYPCKKPSNPYICIGCWMLRRKRVTIPFIDGTYKDGQCPIHFSWLITRDFSTSISISLDTHKKRLVDFLIKPPLQFCLSIITRSPNNLQMCKINDFQEIKLDTSLLFYVDGIEFQYSVYELEQAKIHGPEGMSPGTNWLVKYLEIKQTKSEPQTKLGRPKNDLPVTSLKRTIRS